MKKISIFIGSLILTTLFFTSCNNDVRTGYAQGIYIADHFTFEELYNIKSYLASKGLESGIIYITGKSVEENDKTAVTQFNDLIKNVNTADIDKIVVSDSLSFCLTLDRLTDVLAEYCYPEK